MIPEPITEILGGPNIYLEEGNNLNLTCVVRDSPEPPQYIFWYRNTQVSCHHLSFDVMAWLFVSSLTSLKLKSIVMYVYWQSWTTSIFYLTLWWVIFNIFKCLFPRDFPILMESPSRPLTMSKMFTKTWKNIFRRLAAVI